MKSTYNQRTYILPLTSEIAGAKCYIGYLTPFLSKTAIDLWEPELRKKIAQGVRVCIFVEQPEDWDWDLAPPWDEDVRWLRINIKRLEEMGAHVTMVQHMHEKVLIIDYVVVWSGSINFLSSNPYKRSEKVDRDDDFLAVTNAFFRFNFERCHVCEKIEWKKIRGAKVLDLQTVTAETVSQSPSEEDARNVSQKDSNLATQKIVDYQLKQIRSEPERNDPPAPESIPDIDEEPLGQWVAAIRRSFQFSVAEISRTTKISRESIFDFEAGRHVPNLKVLVKVLNVLGYDLIIVPKQTSSLHHRIAKGYANSEIAKKMLNEASKNKT